MTKYQTIIPIDSAKTTADLYNIILDTPDDFEKQIAGIKNNSLKENESDDLGGILTKFCELINDDYENHKNTYLGSKDSKYVEQFKKFISKIDVASLPRDSHKDFLHGLISNRRDDGENSFVIPIIFEMVKVGFDPGVHADNGQNALEIAVQQSQPVQNRNRDKVLEYVKNSRANPDSVTIDNSLESRLISDARIVQIFLRSGKISEFENKKGCEAAEDIEELFKTKNYKELRNYLGENFHHRKYSQIKTTLDSKAVSELLLNGPEIKDEQPEKPGTNPNSNTSLIARLCSWIRLR